MIFGQDFLDRLKDNCTVYDIISPYVTLERKGRSFWGCCPFHNEKTPSFQVDNERGTFHCYGCGQSGDIFSFLQNYKNMSFVEAVAFVAHKVGLELPTEEETPEQKRRKKNMETGYAVLKEAAIFYKDCLWSGQYDVPVNYLLKRGIDSLTIKTFGFGYSPDYQSLINHLRSKGFSDESILFAGVGQNNKGRLFDAQATRLVVPLIDARGRVIGFGGRRLDEAMAAKYKNTLTTAIFEKQNNLYNLNNFLKLRTSDAILVEGYFDVISLWQSGVQNVLASMGTAFTEKQCDLFVKYRIENIYVCFDGDSAGQHATARSLDMLKGKGLKVKVVSLPDGLDPDDAVKKLGKDGFLQLIDKALPLIDYKLNLIEKTFPPVDSDGRAKYVKEALKMLNSLNDSVVAEIYVDTIAEKSGIDKDTLLAAIRKTAPKSTPPKKEVTVPKAEPKPALTDAGLVSAARIILAAVLELSDFVNPDDIKESYFVTAEHKKVWEYINTCMAQKSAPKISSVYNLLEGNEEGGNIDKCFAGLSYNEKKNSYLTAIKKLHKNSIQERLKTLSQEYADTSDSAQKTKIMKQIAELTANDKKGV